MGEDVSMGAASASETAARAPVALVIGAGEATGAAVARRFAREGYTVCAVRRQGERLLPLIATIEAAGGRAHGFACDARDESAVIELVADIENRIGAIEVAVFNVGGNVHTSILDETAERYFKVWEMGCLAGFHVGREAARRMVPRARGTILYTGATASVRGGAGFAAFAGAKHALRSLAQSMARELGPKGIHVAHVVIDGVIDTEYTRTVFPERYVAKAHDGILQPEAIAENYWQLHAQPRSAWTFELDLRPWSEKW